VISCGLYKENELSVLIDIGTNGEIALGNREFIVACAASAGPAFEGSGVSCGMRSSRGAVQKAHIDIKNKKVGLETIGGAPALGICGTGYIDLIASLLSHGLIDRSGKFDPKGFRVRQGDSGLEFVVASKEECGAERDIVITEADIENLKRSKAAIYSAVSVLARHMNFQLCDIRKFFIAGAFGTSLDIESSVKIGLLPDLDRSRFEFIGNSALAGARLALVSTQAKALSEQLARSITYFELSTDPGYMDEYMSAMFFPHTDLKRFPSV
jgi:uncharacterized 2Fe-2S/4Fe-4S cluster protein (DUF4445 family)